VLRVVDLHDSACLGNSQSSTLKDITSMDRRITLKCLGVSAFGLNFPAVAVQPSEKVPIVVVAPEDSGDTLSVPPAVACRIIGVGDAGCNIVIAAWSSGLLHANDCEVEFSCVSMGRQSIRGAIAANRLNPGTAPIRTVQLAQFGAGGNVEVARAAARKHDGVLRSLIDGADMVILVCGIGGGTGSGVAPILGGIAQESGALTLAVVVTPFRWELGRYPNAFQAVKALERHSSYLVSLSNQVVGDLLGEQATLDDLIDQQELLGTVCIHRLMVDGSRFCIESRSRPAQ
jgi:hypothetical protein